MSFASFFPRYLLALVATLGAYGLYSKFVTPLIESEVTLKSPGPLIPNTQRSGEDIKSELTGLFPSDGWEWNPCTILETEQAKILFHDHTVLDDGSIELKPLSLVLSPPTRVVGGELVQPPPLVLRSPDGARLKFENGFSTDGDLGKLEHGHLAGEVRLYRPESKPGANDALTLETQNVQISPEIISTLYECRFRFGESYGRGKHLTVHMVGPATQTASTTTFTDVHRVRLARVDELFLNRKKKQADESGMLTSSVASESGDLLSDADQSFVLQSRGPMEVDFLNKTASFQDEVLVQSADKQGDQLKCEHLTVFFDNEPSPAGDSNSPSSSSNGMLDEESGDLKIKRLLAEGKPGAPVVLTATSREAEAVAESMDYDLQNNRVTLTAEQSNVTLARQKQWMQAREIQYSFVEDGRLGNALLKGPGQMRQTDREDPSKQMLVQWEQKMTIQEDTESPGKKIVSLDGAKLSMNGTRVNARQMHIWFWEVPEPTKTGKNKWRFEPAKLLAEGDVSIDSDKLVGNCNEVAAFWPPPFADAPQLGRTHQLSYNRYVVARTTYGPQEWGAPVYQASTHDNAQQAPPSTSRTRFVGVQVQLQMRGGADKGAVDKMRVDGDVAVQQMQVTDGIEETKLDIRGTALEVITRGVDLYRLIILGSDAQPAVVTAEELMLQGNKITLDQPANRLWIDGTGRLKLENLQPATRQIDRGGNSFQASPVSTTVNATKRTSTTDVTWQGGMVFDGQQIYFETDVQSNSLQRKPNENQSTNTRTASAALSITLNRRIDFSSREDDQNAEDLEAIELVMVGWLQQAESAFPKFYREVQDRRVHVAVGNYGPDGNMVSSQEIYAPRATFDVRSGHARCKGPGTVLARQLGAERRLAGNASTQLIPPQERAQPGDKITFVQVDYDDMFEGNLNDRELNFTGNVHTFYEDVDRWDVVPNESSIRRPGSRGVIMDCQQLTLAQWTPQGSKPVIEMVATGNSRVKGGQFDAIAERISYTEANGQVTIEAPNRGNAELMAAAPGRTKRGKLVGKTITYNLVTGEARVQQMKRMNFSQQGR